MTNKALLLRVGMDTGTDNKLAKISNDYTFKWTPMSGHHDPNFNELSYGDAGPEDKSQRIANKIPQLGNLSKGDLLVFYAGLEHETTKEKAVYIIGYYLIDKVYDFINKKVSEKEFEKAREELKNYKNPHVNFLNYRNDWDIIILGEKGGLLKKAIHLGDIRLGQYYMSDFLFFLKYYKTLTRAGTGHWIDYDLTLKLLKDKELQIGIPIEERDPNKSEFTWEDGWCSLSRLEISDIINDIKKDYPGLYYVDVLMWLTGTVFDRGEMNEFLNSLILDEDLNKYIEEL
jgi:hypothetical protein